MTQTPESDRAPIKECYHVVNKANSIRQDKKIGEKDNFLRHYIRSFDNLVKFGIRNEYLTKKQIQYANGMWHTYQKIVKLNESLEEDFPNMAARLLEDIHAYAHRYINVRGMPQRRGQLTRRAAQIRGGEYIWYNHLASAEAILKDLPASKDVDAFQDRLEPLWEKVKPDGMWADVAYNS